MFTDLDEVDTGWRKFAKKLAKSFLVWNNKVFKRTMLGPKIVVDWKNGVPTLKMLHDQIGHWMPKPTDSSIQRGSGGHQLVPT